jgi:hypothetical protein
MPRQAHAWENAKALKEDDMKTMEYAGTKYRLMLETAKTGNIVYYGGREKALELLASAATRNKIYVYEYVHPKMPEFSGDLLDDACKMMNYIREKSPKELAEDPIDFEAPSEVFSVEYADDEMECFLTVPHPDEIGDFYTECLMVESLEEGGYRYFALLRCAGIHQVFVSEDVEWWSDLIRAILGKQNSREVQHVVNETDPDLAVYLGQLPYS